jgi:hypothetical protein
MTNAIDQQPSAPLYAPRPCVWYFVDGHAVYGVPSDVWRLS